MNPKGVAVYIHFPFCQRKCAYCDFFSEDHLLERIDSWVAALEEEIHLRLAKLNFYPKLSTIYIGGGSPNLLGAANLKRIVGVLQAHADWSSLEEFTVELNPNYVTEELVTAMCENGVNRISLGCQSFQNAELAMLGRLHSTTAIETTLQLLQHAGFANLSIDLIYGIPGQTLQTWANSLQRALDYRVAHLSLYNLIYEKGTQLSKARAAKRIPIVAEEVEWQMFAFAHEKLADYGYEHYEISNWGKPGYASSHNQAYWQYRPYLGFGPAAHSFYNMRRSWNVGSVDQYIRQLQQGKIPIAGHEVITPPKRDLEILMLCLRTRNGVSRILLQEMTGVEYAVLIKALEQKFAEKTAELWYITEENLSLTPLGWFLYNSVLTIFIDLIGEVKNGH